MRCPIVAAHQMVEIAPEVFQCPLCGLGTTSKGHHPIWAISSVEIEDGVSVYAHCVRFLNNRYSLSELEWALDDDGHRTGGLVEELLVPALTQEDIEELGLPVVIKTKNPWQLDPLSILSELMYDRPGGLKEIDL